MLAPEYLKTQEIWNEAVYNPYMLRYVSDFLKTQEMCEEADEASSWQLKYVPDQYKMQEMCNKAVRDDSSSFGYVPDWFITRGWVCMWYDDSDYWADDEDNFLSDAM